MTNRGAARNRISSLEEAIAQCLALGMRVSRQRRYILELLWQEQEHLLAKEIYHRLNQRGKSIGYTSVYQNLEALCQGQIIECLDRQDGRLYGHRNDAHSHVNCLDTQQILDVDVELPSDLLARIEAETGVRITNYRIDFYGYNTPCC